LGWKALETSFFGKSKIIENEFGVKSYGVFREVSCVVFVGCVSAVKNVEVPWNGGGSAKPYRS
jgi:hypothetical protein